MSKSTSIVLGNHFENFVKNSINEGKYKNASEVVRAGLKFLEEEENRAVLLKEALIEGEESGFDEDFDSKEFLKDLKESHAA